MNDLPAEVQEKLVNQKNIWIATVRPDGRPHLSPVWFVFHNGRIYISIDPTSVKARNLKTNPQIVAALEDGLKPVICEGTARQLSISADEGAQAEFYRKYEWDLTTENQYNLLIEITPAKWLYW